MTSPLPPEPSALRRDTVTCKKIEINHRRNKSQDHTALLDEAAKNFRYEDCKSEYWNPEEFSLLHGTPLWEQADQGQRVILNQLFWVAYYAQIISAEVATIFFNQTSAAGLYGLADFREVCDMLDLESAQERAHINAFITVNNAVEAALFGERCFSYDVRGPFYETMIFPDSNRLKAFWKSLQLRGFGLLSSGSAFIASQYFTVRGMRTLNGKMVQQQLSLYYQNHPDQQNAPLPSAISYYHFMDESYHFNSSRIVGLDVVRSLPAPTRFEKRVANLGLAGCQRDHSNFSAVINGLFWHEPATFPAIYKVLRSPIFSMSDADAREMMKRCFCQENDAIHRSFQTLTTAAKSYQKFLDPLDYLAPVNRDIRIMKRASIERYLATSRRGLAKFKGAGT